MPELIALALLFVALMMCDRGGTGGAT